MNLARVLDVSLPELPRLEGKERYYRFNPNLIWREKTERGVTHFLAIAPQNRRVFMFTPERWKLVQLFDGVRSYEQISRLWKKECGTSVSAEAIRKFADGLDSNGFWLKTAEEEALLMMEELKVRQLRVKKKRSFRDITRVYIFTVDADQLIARAHRYVKFIYTPAFVIGSLLVLAWMIGLWIARWDEVWRDSAQYWSMTGKTWRDVLEFYLIFAVVGFFHESGHALSAKNVGAGVHKVGLMLIYTIPAFFVETTEVVVHGNYFQRMYVILAGFWYELMLCAIATFVWWGTAAGGDVHDIAYKFILVGGIMPVVFNMNPLMRLDGYLFFSKLIRMPFLKEQSTAYWSGWVQNRIFRLPVKVEPLPRRRAIFFAAYAFLSGLYSYSVLLFLARITYRVALNITPDWAFLPAAFVAFSIFRSRIEKFFTFVRTFYDYHKETMKAQRRVLAAAGAAAFLFLITPLWRETVKAPVILEPRERAFLTAHVSGLVDDVLVQEGQSVKAGAAIARIRGLDLETEKAKAVSQLQQSSAAAVSTQLRYADFAGAEAERRRWVEAVRVAGDKERRLIVTTPIDGVVVTPRTQDLRGIYLTEGSPVAEVQDLSVMRARIFVNESDVRLLPEVTGSSIRLDSNPSSLHGSLETIGSTPEEPPRGLVDLTKYKGLRAPPRYVVSVLLTNDGTLRTGMSGEAKLFGRRRSIVEKVWKPIADFAGRKLW